MHICLSKEILLHNINIVSKAVSPKASLSILECILLMADSNGFKLLGNDLELGIEAFNIEADIKEEGVIALEAKMFFEIIRRLPENEVTINVDKNNITTITSGTSEFKILGQPGDEFPLLPEVEKANEYTISSNVFKNMIRQTIFSVSSEESKPTFKGELIEIKDSVFNIVALDGYRISFRKTDIPVASKTASFIVPAKTLNDISKILPDKEEEIMIYSTGNHILFSFSGCTVVSRLIEGEYLKYNHIFTDDYSTLINIKRQYLLTALERSVIVSREANKTPVVLTIKQEIVAVASNAELGTSYEEINAEMDGNELEIAFNPKYLIEALKAIDDEDIAIQFTTSLSPCIIRGTDTDEYKYLVLPLRLKN